MARTGAADDRTNLSKIPNLILLSLVVITVVSTFLQVARTRGRKAPRWWGAMAPRGYVALAVDG